MRPKIIQGEPQDVDAAIYDLAEGLSKKGSTAIFAGAGISFHSGLPLVHGQQKRERGKIEYTGLTEVILSKLGVNDEEIQLIRNSDLPFEAFMENLRAHSDTESIYSIFGAGQPNTTHKLLAQLIKRGHVKTLCTTNFDRLIERALRDEGWHEGIQYEVIFEEEEFAHIDWNDKPKIIKIHGSVDKPESMAITLRQVADEAPSGPRWAVINQLFGRQHHRRVLILGYSSSDAFDILPQIQAVTGEKSHITYIEHTERAPRAEDIATKEEKNPFKNYNGVRLHYDTDSLVEKLWTWEDLGIEEDYEMRRTTIPWREKVDLWLRSRHPDFPEELLNPEMVKGYILNQIGAYPLALKYLRNAANNINNSYLKIRCLMDIAQTYSVHLRDQHMAKKYAGQARELLNATQSPMNQAVWVRYFLPDILQIEGDHEGSIEAASNILIPDDWRDSEDKKIYSYLASAKHATTKEDYVTAESFYQMALVMSRRYGYLSLEGWANLGLGNMYYSFEEEGTRTITCYKEALQIGKKLKNRELETHSILGLGRAFVSKGRFEDVDRLAADESTVPTVALGLGEILLDHEKFSESISFCQRMIPRIGAPFSPQEEAGGSWVDAQEAHSKFLTLNGLLSIMAAAHIKLNEADKATRIYSIILESAKGSECEAIFGPAYANSIEEKLKDARRMSEECSREATDIDDD